MNDQQHQNEATCGGSALTAELARAQLEIKKLRGAIEAMRTAGGRHEFQRAFDAAKELVRT